MRLARERWRGSAAGGRGRGRWRQGKIGGRNDVALAVQQPFNEGAVTGVDPQHIGVPVAVEVSHSDDLPRRGTSGSAGPGKTGSRNDMTLAVQQPFIQRPATG